MEHSHDEVRRLFDLVIEAPTDARESLLDRECGRDGELKHRVRAMVAAAEDDRFLGAPTSDNSPEDSTGPSGDETIRPEPRKDTLPPSGGSDFQHGRFEPGQRLGSRYRIVGLLGKGGMGEVYRADDLELGQSVALKFLPQRVATDQSWLRRFRNEVRTARQVAHANVCRIYDIGEQDGHVFLTMEYIDGEDLASVLRRLGRPSREKAIEIARQICFGLAAAHENNVLHRDLKPANIMIDGRGHVRITDFGLAGFLDELERVEARAGTPAYMAPEQLANGKVSVRSDVYSLGLIMHELFTGKCVFDTHDIEELKRKHTSGSVTPPSSITEQIDPAVERVIMRCLEQKPQQRPQSVYQVLAALPGGDPLAAALAAGELPAPDLVANARDAGGLRPAVAVGLLATTLMLWLITFFVSADTTVLPDRSPTELSVVTAQIMDELGYSDLPGHSVFGLQPNPDLGQSLNTSGASFDELTALQWPPKYRFWRRWTDGQFIPLNMHTPEIHTPDGAIRDSSGVATIWLDDTGRLLGFNVPAHWVDSASAPAGEIDWSSIFRRAGLNPAEAVEVPPVEPAPIFCDQVAAWRIEGLGDGSEPVIVQMGAVGGRPNYFEILGLRGWGLGGAGSSSVTTMMWPPVTELLMNVFLIVLALRNLRASRADKRNALRCALLIGGLYGLMEVLSIPLDGSGGSSRIGGLLAGRGAGHVLLHAVWMGMFYMAIEPYVRRVWPLMLVGLIRLLSGRVRDPAVGREVLIGLTAGVGLLTILALTDVPGRLQQNDAPGQLAHWAQVWFSMTPLLRVSNLAHIAGWTVRDAALIAAVLVAFRLLTRHTLAAMVLGVVVFGTSSLLWYVVLRGEPDWAAFVYATCFGVVIVSLFTRVGILAGIIAIFVLRPHAIYTTDGDAWLAPYTMVDGVIVLALAVYGFWVALAGQPIFRDMFGEAQAAR